MAAIRKEAKVTIVYQDEAHFGQTATIMRSWALMGSAPEVKSPAGRKSISYSGFVIPEDGRLIMTRPSWFNSDNVIESIKEFLEAAHLEEDQLICLVLDNAPWHKKAIRLIEDENIPEYADIRKKIHFELLPPYSPDLNPIEQVWRITRREVTHNRYFRTLGELEEKLNSYFNNFSTPNEKFRTLCTFNYNI